MSLVRVPHESARGSGHTLQSERPVEPKPIVLAELIASVALALSTVVAATAVSIGIARAETVGALADGGGGQLSVALVVGLFLASVGVFTVAATRDR